MLGSVKNHQYYDEFGWSVHVVGYASKK
jgi:hypothetical protein